MKLANFAMGLSTTLVLTVGVSYQVKAHGGGGLHTHTQAEVLTEETTDELVEQYLQGLPELPITEADINAITQQLEDRLSVEDDSTLPNVFILPEDLKIPDTILGEWVASLGGNAFQFNIIGSEVSSLDQPITNTISTSEFDTPFSAGVAFVPPGTGAPAHVHWWEDEWYWVLKGNIDWFLGNNEYEDGDIPGVNAPLEEQINTVNIGTGELVYSPDNRLHGYQNNTDETAILIHFWRRLTNTDGGFEQFFLEDELGRLVETPSAAIPPNNEIDLEYLEWAQQWTDRFPEFGGVSNNILDEYLREDAIFEPLDPQILKDNNAKDLVALFRQVPELRQNKSIPEASGTSGILALGALLSMLTLKRKIKPERDVST
ncbi:cupin domain-containing protein [Moorena sp. SIO4A5]|uniref:cupin domain-containing protein n=1 Tax=Moorena sp. SIO4A5 TaxID=2607838 RepID=UPI0013C61F51|nr:cupin domain-containing protein [Moorena sp. SIO4A5]NEO18528.1 cupin domain-containing protein [Moorena sp. SIO4A5]